MHIVAMGNTTRNRTDLTSDLRRNDTNAVVWEVWEHLADYTESVERMSNLADAIFRGEAPETVWLVEHPPLFTGGTNAKTSDLLMPDMFPVHQTGRGGEYTYHGPGQRVAYVMLNLAERSPDVRLFVSRLEQWVINSLDQFNVKGERREDRVGVWVTRPDKHPLPDGRVREDKIAAIGIRLRKWVTFHGISLNVEPDLDHYAGIVSCGVQDHGVTSLADLGLTASMDDVDLVLRQEFEKIFGPVK